MDSRGLRLNETILLKYSSFLLKILTKYVNNKDAHDKRGKGSN